jgi:DNA-binding transcriptional regulator YiaG
MSENQLRRCVECGEAQRLVRGTSDYPESGLDNVQLLNVPLWVCINKHEELEVPAVEELHDLLAHMVVRQPAPLSAKDIRFLRKRLQLTAREFSAQMGWTPEWQSQLENGHVTAQRPADLLMKLACGALLAKKTGRAPGNMAQLVEELEAAWPLGAHRLRHNDEAEHEWEEATA